MGDEIRIVTFDGAGKPKLPGVVTGSVLLLVQRGEVYVVKLELVPPNEYGPKLHHAINEHKLEGEARTIVRAAHPESLASRRAVLLECPTDLARRARFAPS